MATINGLTAEKMQEILDQTIATATIEGSSLVFTTTGGSEIVAGTFDDALADYVASRLAGSFFNRGNLTGAVSFSDVAANLLPNAMMTATLTGNISIDVSALPSGVLPGTQFVIRFMQDATGGRTLTLTGFKRSQGVMSLTPTANAIDIVVFLYDGATWYAGLMGVDFK